MNGRLGWFLFVALATLVAAGFVGEPEIYAAVVVPVAYALSDGVGEPYKEDMAMWAGIVSSLSFTFLVIAAGYTAPGSTAFSVAWYGYIATSSLYALAMRTANKSMHEGRRIFAYVMLMLAIALSVAVAVRVVMESNDVVGKIFGVAGALFSVSLDGTVTAHWFAPPSASWWRILVGLCFVLLFAFAFVDNTIARVVLSVASFVALVAATYIIRPEQRGVRSLGFELMRIQE